MYAYTTASSGGASSTPQNGIRIPSTMGVRIEAQDPESGKTVHTGSCYLTYVAIDSKGRPKKIPKLLPQTPDEKRRFKQAYARRKLREAEVEAFREP